MTRSTKRLAFGLVALAFAASGPATAGMGKVFPTYHPKPCDGDDCRADDPRSHKDCTGLLCTFSSAKAMQPPVTATQAAEAEKARAAALAAAAAAPPPASVTPVEDPHKRKLKRVAKRATPALPADASSAAKSPPADAAH